MLFLVLVLMNKEIKMEDYNLTNAQKRIIYTEEIYCEPRISNEGGFYKISTLLIYVNYAA